ncbi:MAG TPA: hypothetical protein PKE42_05830 [Arachnia sp.]|jgi:hypothetical protein|nr:hypothetical protein [Arachnia sp.]
MTMNHRARLFVSALAILLTLVGCSQKEQAASDGAVCGSTIHTDYGELSDEEAALAGEGPGIAADPEAAARDLIRYQLTRIEDDPETLAELEEARALLARVESGQPLSAQELAAGGQTLIDLAASHRAFAALDEAFESGTIEAEVRKEAGQTVYRSPEAEFEASVTVSTHGEVWVADTYHYELPRSMCSDAVG